MNIIPFDSAKVPAVITTMFGDTAGDLVGNASSDRFPVVSIKGKVFHIQRGDERVLVTRPGEDEPATSIEVVIVRANPNRSKVFYATGYQEGSTEKPTCYSNNGVTPEADAQEKQSTKCATCQHNQWGSRVSGDGFKGKACGDSRRLAIATVDTPKDPMLVRVPAGSMKSLEEYGKILAARGVPPQAVVTKISFDHSVAHPSLVFKPVGLIGDPQQLAEIKEMVESDIVASIVGLPKTSAALTEAKKAAETADAVERVVATAANTKKVDTPVAAPAAKPAKPAPAPAPVQEVGPAPVAQSVSAPPAVMTATTGTVESDIQSMLDEMNFDD